MKKILILLFVSFFMMQIPSVLNAQEEIDKETWKKLNPDVDVNEYEFDVKIAKYLSEISDNEDELKNICTNRKFSYGSLDEYIEGEELLPDRIRVPASETYSFVSETYHLIVTVFIIDCFGIKDPDVDVLKSVIRIENYMAYIGEESN